LSRRSVFFAVPPRATGNRSSRRAWRHFVPGCHFSYRRSVFQHRPAGFITLELLYDSPLGALPLASPLPEPDRLATVTSSEFYEICIFPPASPVGCSLGTIGTQTFSRGEFNFTAAKIAEPSSAVLMLAGLIVSCLLVLRREHG